MIEIHAKSVTGSWDEGYVLDVHTISSTMIGYNEFGYPEVDTVRSQLGQLVYRLKYKGDKTVIPPVVEATVAFVKSWGVHPDVIVPMPPSKSQRNFQPVVEVAGHLAELLGVPLNTTSLNKTSPTQQMKDIGDLTARTAALEAVMTSDTALEGKAVLLFDDLFQSGASMNVSARALKQQGLVRTVYA